MNFLEKLDFLMDKYKLNKHSFSQAAGIPYTTVDALYKKGYERIKLDTLQKIADYFNTSLDYLVREEVTDPNFGRNVALEINPEEAEMISGYRHLSHYAKETIRILMERELGSGGDDM